LTASKWIFLNLNFSTTDNVWRHTMRHRVKLSRNGSNDCCYIAIVRF